MKSLPASCPYCGSTEAEIRYGVTGTCRPTVDLVTGTVNWEGSEDNIRYSGGKKVFCRDCGREIGLATQIEDPEFVMLGGE